MGTGHVLYMFSFHGWLVYGDSMMVHSGILKKIQDMSRGTALLSLILLSKEYIGAFPPASPLLDRGKNHLCTTSFKGIVSCVG
jgi:hypothetical protein